MFKPVRVVATFIFLGSIVLVFVGAFVIGSDVSSSYYHIAKNTILNILLFQCPGFMHQYVPPHVRLIPHHPLTQTLLSLHVTPHNYTVFVIIEYLAYTWYTLSYIPYARSAVLKVFGM